MFIIASSGRCGTQALCNGLNRFSDHEVEHEPEPVLHRQSYRKHHRNAYRNLEYWRRMAFFRARSGQSYGQSFRAANLLNDVRRAAPRTKFLILVREPLSYVLSAHYKRVLRKGNKWDTQRLMPAGSEHETLAARLALHWEVVNNYLLDYSDETGAPVLLLQSLGEMMTEISGHPGVTISDSQGLDGFLAAKPNASATHDEPEGWDPDVLYRLVAPTWERAQNSATV